MNTILNSMQKLALLAISVFFCACENPNAIGYTIEGSGYGSASYTDTLNIASSTILADSNITGRGSFLMAGITTDPIFGKAKAICYFQPMLNSVTSTLNVTSNVPLTFNANPIIDSVKLRLVNSGLIFGDTVALNTFNIHKLKSSMDYTKTYNGDQSLDYDPTSITSFTINGASFKNATYDTTLAYFVNLPKSVANSLLTVSATNGAENSLFNAAYTGFAIVPASNSKTIFTFNTGVLSSMTSTFMTYWHYAGDTLSTSYQFELSGPRHSYLTFDRSGTALTGLSKSKNEIARSNTSNSTFVQSGSGISTKLDFSNIKNLGANIKVNQVLLDMTMPSFTLNPLYRKDSIYVLAEVDSRNQQVRTSDNYASYLSGSGSTYTGTVSKIVDTTATVTFNVTNFIQKILNNRSTNYKLMMIPAKYTSTGSGLISNDNLRRAVFLKPKVRIYYSKY